MSGRNRFCRQKPYPDYLCLHFIVSCDILYVLSLVADECADELCTAGYVKEVESTAAGYQLRVQLPSVFYKYIIGKKGETKKRLESETRTQIRIPRQNEEGDIGTFFII